MTAESDRRSELLVAGPLRVERTSDLDRVRVRWWSPRFSRWVRIVSIVSLALVGTFGAVGMVPTLIVLAGDAGISSPAGIGVFLATFGLFVLSTVFFAVTARATTSRELVLSASGVAFGDAQIAWDEVSDIRLLLRSDGTDAYASREIIEGVAADPKPRIRCGVEIAGAGSTVLVLPDLAASQALAIADALERARTDVIVDSHAESVDEEARDAMERLRGKARQPVR